jgi:hypothetical protein
MNRRSTGAFEEKTSLQGGNMRSQSVWAGQEETRTPPKGISSVACLLAVALLGTAVWSGALWVYQIWYN